MDFDDELPYITFSSGHNVPFTTKNSDDIFIADRTEVSGSECRGSAESVDIVACADLAGVVVVDSDSNNSDLLLEFTPEYSQSLRERCTAASPSPFIESHDLPLDVVSAKVLMTAEQSCCNSLTEDTPVAFKSSENSEELASKPLSQRTSSETCSQTSSIQSNDSKRRKRPPKADDPEAVVCI